MYRMCTCTDSRCDGPITTNKSPSGRYSSSTPTGFRFIVPHVHTLIAPRLPSLSSGYTTFHSPASAGRPQSCYTSMFRHCLAFYTAYAANSGVHLDVWPMLCKRSRSAKPWMLWWRMLSAQRNLSYHEPLSVKQCRIASMNPQVAKCARDPQGNEEYQHLLRFLRDI